MACCSTRIEFNKTRIRGVHVLNVYIFKHFLLVTHMEQFLHFSSSVVWNNIKKRTYFSYWKLNERHAGNWILVSSIRLAVPNESCILQNVLPRAQFRSTLHPFYYSFKIIPQFWLAKSTRTIHYNQLLMTKFARILCLTRKWRQKCNPLQVKAPLPRRPGNEVELFWLWKKMADFSLLLRVRTTAETRRNL